MIVSLDKRQSVWGYNGFPRGIEDTQERLLDRELKNTLTVHAELNAILNADFSLKGWQLYSTTAPCFCRGCAHAIIQKGISWVIAPGLDHESSWYADQLKARALFEEAGINQIILDRSLPEVLKCSEL
jgi:dCMP deaminase